MNTRLGTDHHQLIMPPISKDCSNTFLERSFIYAAPCEWNKLSEHIRTSNFDCFRKSVKNNVIYTTIWMLTVNVYIIVIYDVITVDYCKCILLYSPLNSYLYMYIGYWTLNKYYYYTISGGKGFLRSNQTRQDIFLHKFWMWNSKEQLLDINMPRSRTLSEGFMISIFGLAYTLYFGSMLYSFHQFLVFDVAWIPYS